MRVHTDDEVYRVDQIWLGPPKATFPWRARYSAYAIGLVLTLAAMFIQRLVGIEFSFFSVGWALLLAVAATKLIGQKITPDRPLWPVLNSAAAEIRTPRRPTRGLGGPVHTHRIRIRTLAPTDTPTSAVQPAAPAGDEDPAPHTRAAAPHRRRPEAREAFS